MPNTSELLSEPETPVNTVSRRFGISMLTSLRLFTRAPCTRIRSWRSATSSAGDFVSVLVALLIVSPSVGRGRLRCLLGVAWLDLTSFEQYVWFSFLGAVGATGWFLPDRRCRPGCATPVRLTLAGSRSAQEPRHPRRFGPWSLWVPPPGVPPEASDQPAAVAHQLAVGQLVHLAPGLDAARGDAEPEVRVARARGSKPVRAANRSARSCDSAGLKCRSPLLV